MAFKTFTLQKEYELGNLRLIYSTQLDEILVDITM